MLMEDKLYNLVFSHSLIEIILRLLKNRRKCVKILGKYPLFINSSKLLGTFYQEY
jgi:hypothetical protein